MLIKDIFEINPVVIDEDSTLIIVNGSNFIDGLICQISVHGIVSETKSTLQASNRLYCEIPTRNDLFQM